MGTFDATKQITKCLVATGLGDLTDLQFTTSKAITRAEGTFKLRGKPRTFSMAWDYEGRLQHFSQEKQD